MKNFKFSAPDLMLSPRDRFCRKIIDYGLLGLIIFSPLPAASVFEWSILVIELSVLIMMIAYFMMKEKPAVNDSLISSLRWPKILFVSLFVIIALQIVPFPNFFVKIVSPNAHAFRENFTYNFTEIKFMSISLIPSLTLQKGLEFLTYFFLGFLVVKTVTQRRQIMKMLTVIIIMGIFEAFYGLFELYNPNPRILFYEKIHNLDSVTGTFVNRNHLSGYLEMIIPLAIGLIITRSNLVSAAGQKLKNILLRSFQKDLSATLFIFFGIITMSMGIILSKSRSGVFLLIFAFILFFEANFLFTDRIHFQRNLIRKFIAVLFLIITFFSLYVGVEATLERFSFDEIVRGRRLMYWTNTIRMIKNYPLFGTGLGTFGPLYPDWEEGEHLIRLYHAHNDYLEYLSEIGILGMMLLFGGILIMIIQTFRSWRDRRHPEAKGLGLGGLIAIICILIHSLTDFNLHIPANMVLFSVVLSLTMVMTFYRKGMRS